MVYLWYWSSILSMKHGHPFFWLGIGGFGKMRTRCKGKYERVFRFKGKYERVVRFILLVLFCLLFSEMIVFAVWVLEVSFFVLTISCFHGGMCDVGTLHCLGDVSFGYTSIWVLIIFHNTVNFWRFGDVLFGLYVVTYSLSILSSQNDEQR